MPYPTLSPADINRGRRRLIVDVNLADDLVETHQRVESELDDLIAAGADNPRPQRMNEPPSAIDAKTAELEQIEAEMAGSWRSVTIEADSLEGWRRFKNANPPREGIGEDDKAGVDWDALIIEYVPTRVVEPRLGDAEWASWRSNHPQALRDLAIGVLTLQERSLDVPKSPLVSVVRQTMSALSELREPSASPNAASTAGSPSPSPEPTTPTGT